MVETVLVGVEVVVTIVVVDIHELFEQFCATTVAGTGKVFVFVYNVVGIAEDKIVDEGFIVIVVAGKVLVLVYNVVGIAEDEIVGEILGDEVPTFVYTVVGIAEDETLDEGSI